MDMLLPCVLDCTSDQICLEHILKNSFTKESSLTIKEYYRLITLTLVTIRYYDVSSNLLIYPRIILSIIPPSYPNLYHVEVDAWIAATGKNKAFLYICT